MLLSGVGRDETEVEYDVGFTHEGRLLGLRLRVALLAGWAQDLAADDGALLKDAAGMVRATKLAFYRGTPPVQPSPKG